MKILIIIISVVLVMLGIGVVQNYYNDPVKGCKKFDTGTEYQGYYCNGTIRYIK